MTTAVLAASMLLTAIPSATIVRTASDTAIHDVVHSLTTAWNTADANAWGQAFTPDASFVNVRGDIVHGRPAIEKIHAFIFSGVYQGTRNDATIDSITYPAPNVAIVESTMHVTGFKTLPPGLVPTEPGKLSTRMKLIFVQQYNGTWQIAAAQNTAISPVPMKVN